MTKVKVNDDTQITFRGETHRGGETFECDDDHAERFIAAGWATRVGRSPKKTKPKRAEADWSDEDAPGWRAPSPTTKKRRPDGATRAAVNALKKKKN